MKQDRELKSVKDLIRLMEQLHTLYGQLLHVVEAKTAATKSADRKALYDCCEAERKLTQRLREREGFRRRLMRAVEEDLGIEEREARRFTLSKLASLLSEGQRFALLDVASRLRKVTFSVGHANRVIGIVTRDILHHLKWVFASVRPKGNSSTGYSDDGGLVHALGTRIFETVG